MLGVILVGRGDPDRLDIRIDAHSLDVVVRFRTRIAGLKCLAGLGAQIGGSHELHLRHALQERQELGAPEPQTRDPDSQLVCHDGLPL
jgi:hypothetical protein